jgi:hypothetical protein
MQSYDVPNEVGSSDITSADAAKRPLRLIIVAVMNVIVGSLSVVALIFILTSPKVPAEVAPDLWNAAFSGGLAVAMIVTSLLALAGAPGARKPALIIALVFFGIILVHGALLAIDPQSVADDIPVDRVRRQLGTILVRTAIEIGLTWWAYQSARTKAFFESRKAEA